MFIHILYTQKKNSTSEFTTEFESIYRAVGILVTSVVAKSFKRPAPPSPHPK